jgi:hypothetical protein
MYITPKWYLNIDKQDEILITTEDIHDLSQKLLRSQPFLWKSAFRGTARDYRLLNKLQQLPTLKEVLSAANVLHDAHRGVIFGKGKQQAASMLQGKPFLASGQIKRYGINIDSLNLFTRPTAERRYKRFLQLPALIISRSLHDQRVEIAVAEPSAGREHLVIDQMYYGIPGSSSHSALVYQLNAILNSNIAFYMAFMFSSALGWDRRLVEEGDWQQIRLPRSILDPTATPIWQEVLQHESWLRENWQPSSASESILRQKILQQQQMLEKSVSELYELSEQEVILVEDTIALGITPILAKNLRFLNALLHATSNDLQNYARRVCTQLNGILNDDGQWLTAIVIEFKQPSPLRACRFRYKNLDRNELITVIQFENIENILEQMSQDLRAEVADHVYVQRSLHVYEPDGFWIIKSAEKRLWSESAALNDADMIVCEHMEEDTEDE